MDILLFWGLDYLGFYLMRSCFWLPPPLVEDKRLSRELLLLLEVFELSLTTFIFFNTILPWELVGLCWSLRIYAYFIICCDNCWICAVLWLKLCFDKDLSKCYWRDWSDYLDLESLIRRGSAEN